MKLYRCKIVVNKETWGKDSYIFAITLFSLCHVKLKFREIRVLRLPYIDLAGR